MLQRAVSAVGGGGATPTVEKYPFAYSQSPLTININKGFFVTYDSANVDSDGETITFGTMVGKIEDGQVTVIKTTPTARAFASYSNGVLTLTRTSTYGMGEAYVYKLD